MLLLWGIKTLLQVMGRCESLDWNYKNPLDEIPVRLPLNRVRKIQSKVVRRRVTMKLLAMKAAGERICRFILSFGSNSLGHEMGEFLEYKDGFPSVSAFVQQRQK